MSVEHKARKRFGQNFLVDQQVIGRIVAAVGASPADNLIEIGPGTAAITEHLLTQCPTMTVIELDRDLIKFLTAKFSQYPEMKIVNGDALTTDFSQFYGGRELRLVGNLPYNISTPLLFHLLGSGHLIKDMHFMLQREVVDRLGASPGTKSYGRLSVMIQYHCRVMPLIPVPPESFRPAPKVQSAVVRLKPHKIKPFVATNELLLGKIVNLCFQQRRKTLRNCLKLYSDHLADIESLVDLTMRPERLSVSDFVAITNAIDQLVENS
ncbi:16S rRNA (adenine(1518)-N(6)/adenine(1519)-N(6))-dimethyltransferase RsmA [Porticoccaceae bacterium]|jgi:16S rRNA (adenine1518-N6/adenine1519-N6)-dimethyltransferase|nr:16S rRNA (adenine(1518)-N(6)/adenine(1519)-N(6))-dimethyltransferase RsmA [Porticoccaceae bacterium]MDB3884620.1 16S rRNA (adenine(1518)-N(6)/adenine(1519)-N(6))-dimethyltransferase RsmA [Porticoccaceae bacterium]MDC0370832.1 16S rRNA (adenine(1518)-N(6)/adenine(1519)-N(6))-dimethyltransferase RsmA [Porticoccaceae bacterium]MDC3198992.1 16S rRNA (adenine(1518)-N(6)/adenine(1519)-N(6))-dimethyltransferase RsmA [Porticoccaceae bacterium]